MLTSEDYSTIFHEIKNSITLIGSSLQLVEKKHPEIAQFPYWAESMSEIAFLRSMVTELSTSRLCSHLNLCQVDLYSYIDSVCRSLGALTLNNFHCEIIAPDTLPAIWIDRQLVKQALTNLLKNAYEAMNQSGTVTLLLSQSSSCVQIDIIDHGGGLDPAFADYIFEPFITSKDGGSGLGLVITRQIIESHHGTITCNSRPGDGCTFTITLPVSQTNP